MFNCRVPIIFVNIFCVLPVFISYVSLTDDFHKDDGIYVLTKTNFNKLLETNENVLAEFYAPWCGHCKALAPEYVRAAQKLRDANSDIKLAKIDATEETELAEEHGVRGYPTLKFFKKGKVIDYTGGRTAEEIVNWLMKKIGPPAKTVNVLEDLQKLIDDNDVLIVGFFKDVESQAAGKYLDAASSLDNFMFVLTSAEPIFKEYGITKDTILIFKKFDDKKTEYTGEFEEEPIVNFIQIRSLPLLIDFNQDMAQRIFSGVIKSHLLIFVSKSSADYKNVAETARSVALEFLDKVLFVTINIDDEDHQRVMEFFGLKKDEIPSLRLIRLEEDMAKYKPESSDLSKDTIRKFVQDYLDGKLKHHFLSEPVPDDWDKKPVKVLVSSIFNEVVMDRDKEVLVEFYAPWCGHCKQLAPIYDELGEKYQDRKDIVIAKIDATANEIEGVKVQNYPTIKLFKKTTNEEIDYNGERTLAGLTKFLETRGEYGKAVPGKAEVSEEEVDETAKHRDEL